MVNHKDNVRNNNNTPLENSYQQGFSKIILSQNNLVQKYRYYTIAQVNKQVIYPYTPTQIRQSVYGLYFIS